ncbi:MAG: VCBS repeat-containing protein [candidate division Zixibacteria bacterium]|nr:VCBS repeat-containing protein [candidate division Zixibacteria bacterium]
MSGVKSRSFPAASTAIMIITLATFGDLSAAFTPVFTGPVVSDAGDSRSANFVDYDNDGDLDLFITNGPQLGQPDYLYRNNGDGTFVKITGDPITTVALASDGATFGDFDNDGDEDCFVATWWNNPNIFYENNGNGTFAQITTGPIATGGTHSEAGSWADYDQDGYLDLYVCNSFSSLANLLFHNNGDGTFTKILTGPQSTDLFRSRVGAWGDYDNDSDLDLFVANEFNHPNNLYRNDGGGTFTKITTGNIVTDLNESFGASWGDIDNDLDLDLFVANGEDQHDCLYTNNGDGTFTKVTTGPVVSSGGYGVGSTFADVDNDGDLDLYVCNAFAPLATTNFLFLNNGDGTFTRDLSDPIATDDGWTYGCAFGDIDADGDLDLALAKCLGASENNALYLNGGNSNHYLALECVGSRSNRSGIGTRLKIKATIGGVPRWQMREVTSQAGYCVQNGEDAWFGLGDALTVDSLVVTWPSGVVRILTNVAADQHLYLDECESTDSDGDLVGDNCDNCPSVGNASQTDSDGDGLGDACDTCPLDALNDADGDGICADLDNCPAIGNVDQADADGDNIGDLCDNCPNRSNPNQADADHDGIGDLCEFVCGDADGSAAISISDAVYLINFIFAGGPAPNPLLSGDADCSNAISISDAVYLINYIFAGGPAPCATCP